MEKLLVKKLTILPKVDASPSGYTLTAFLARLGDRANELRYDTPNLESSVSKKDDFNSLDRACEARDGSGAMQHA